MLRYESAGRVSASAIRKIRAEIEALDRVWWRGAVGFDADRESGGPALLEGRTALFHPHGVPDPDDLFMAFADASFILERLQDWAKRFKIKWHLRMNDEDWGAIDGTGCTRPLLDQMKKWSRRAGVVPAGKGRWSIPEERRSDLLRSYPGRH